MNKKTIIIIAAIIAAFAGIVGISIAQSQSEKPAANESTGTTYESYDRAVINSLASELDVANINPFTITGNEEGMIADHVKGDPERAQIVLYEFADFQCSHCAEWNPVINQLIKDADGRIALVFRSYPLSYNTNAVMVASAAEAASLQGYWQEFKDLAFANQDDWFYQKHEKLQTTLEKYFTQVSKNSGDLEKFRDDMKSELVARRLALNMALAKKAGLKGTPAFYIDGEFIEIKDLRTTLQNRLK